MSKKVKIHISLANEIYEKGKEKAEELLAAMDKRNAAKKEAAQINDMFGYMEKSTNIMKNFILEQISEESDIQNEEMLKNARTLFLNIVQNAEGAVSCCLRFDPELAGPQAGFVYSIAKNNTQFEECEPTDLSLYSKEDEKVKFKIKTAENISAEEKEVYDLIETEIPISAETLCRRLHKDIQDVQYILSLLELSGYIRKIPQAGYVRDG